MKKIEIIIIGLLLLMATALTIGSAETETTYYCYNNGEWGTCTPQDAITCPGSHDKGNSEIPLAGRNECRAQLT